MSLQFKVEYGQPHKMAAPIGGRPFILRSGARDRFGSYLQFYRFSGQEARARFLSIIATISKWKTKAVPNNGAPKAPPT
jgi:hypothetical protein